MIINNKNNLLKDEFFHVGVPGMKWGKRKAPEQVEKASRSSNTNIKNATTRKRTPLTSGQKAAKTRQKNILKAQEEKKMVRSQKRVSTALWLIGGQTSANRAMTNMALSGKNKAAKSLALIGTSSFTGWRF